MKGRAIDIVQVALTSPVDVPPEVERFVADMVEHLPDTKRGGRSSGLQEFMFNFLVKGNPTKSPAEMETRLTGEMKGLISKKLIDVKWSGGLSNDFAPDRALKDQLVASGVDNLTIEAIPDLGSVRISHIHKVRHERRADRHTYKELPSLQIINTIEMIAHHIRTRYMR